MFLDRLQRRVDASDIAPERLAANQAVSEKDKIAEASRQFEAVLLRQVLADAQKPVFGSSMVKDSASASIYRDMITSQMADHISKSGTFGLAKALEPQLQHQLGVHDPQEESGATGVKGAAGQKLETSLANNQADGKDVATPSRYESEIPAHAALQMRQLLGRARQLKSHE